MVLNDGSAAALQLYADSCAVRERQGFADADFNELHFAEFLEDAFDDPLAERFKQIDMCLRAFVYDGVAQQAIIQDCLYVLVMDLLIDVHVELGVDVQWLSGAQFVLENADTCIQGYLAKENTAGGHNVGLVELLEL